MNKIPRSGSLLRPVIFSLIALTVVGSFGCNNRPGDGEPPINEDTVRKHAIPIKEAIDFTTSFRTNIDSFARKYPDFQKTMNFGKAEAFDRDVFRVLLKQKDSLGNLASGIRIYFGRDSLGKIKFVMVPYDANGNDILKHLSTGDEKQVPGVSPAKTERSAQDGGAQAMETGQICPTACSPGSPLNQ